MQITTDKRVAKLITKSIFTSPAADETDKMLEQLIRSRLVATGYNAIKKKHAALNLSFFRLPLYLCHLRNHSFLIKSDC